MQKFLVFTMIIAALVVTGYVKNIVKLCKCDFKAPYKAEAVHAAGIIPPVGIITGWLNIEDGCE